MIAKKHAFPIRLIAFGFDDQGRPNLRGIIVIMLVALSQAGLVFLGSYLDRTLWLPNEGKGFLEHYGVWAILATDPLLLITTSLAYRRYFIALNTLPLKSQKLASSERDQIVRPFEKFLNLKDKGKFVYALIVAIGLLSWLNNLRQTTDHQIIYGNDVFDAYSYHWGYYANKLNLFGSWVLVYPIVGFQLVTMGVSVRLILQRLKANKSLTPNVMHPDGCYGLFDLGFLNVCLLIPYMLSYSSIFALFLTHENRYFSILAALAGLTLAMLAVSFLTIGPITSLGKEVKRQTYKRLEEKSQRYNSNNIRPENRFALERLCFSTARASPYSQWAQTVITALRLTPVVLTVSGMLL